MSKTSSIWFFFCWNSISFKF